MESLSKDAVGAIAHRLSKKADLVLPGSLVEAGAPEPDESKRKEYLTALLERDAGVMLERYGDELTPEELDAFQPLREDYEVWAHSPLPHHPAPHHPTLPLTGVPLLSRWTFT